MSVPTWRNSPPHMVSGSRVTFSTIPRISISGSSVPALNKARGFPVSAIVLVNRQRNGRVENVGGIVLPLDGQKPFEVAAIALRHPLHIAAAQHVRIAAGQRHRLQGLARGAHPLLMPDRLADIRLAGKAG